MLCKWSGCVVILFTVLIPGIAVGMVGFFDPALRSRLENTENAAHAPVEALLDTKASALWKEQLARLTQETSSTGRNAQDAWSKKADAYALRLLIEPITEKTALDLEELEKRMPGTEQIATSLSFAYERLGRFDRAKEWLDQAMRRKRSAASATEWLTLLIIQARERLLADPTALVSGSVLGSDFGTQPAPRWPTVPDRARWAPLTKKALLLELRSRLGTAASPDPVIGDLLFSLANLYSLTGGTEPAAAIASLAKEYGVANGEVLELRLKQWTTTIAEREGTKSKRSMAYAGVGVLLLAIAGFIFLLRTRGVKRARTKG